jgi:GH15 family glucan-1,4-alpha-glucosidase
VNRIGDYALIGDCHSAALVGRDGSVDWACFPRFDSRAVFARILDEERGGAFSLAPAEPAKSTRAYLDDTNVLRTTFRATTGVLELTDCLALARHDPADPAKVDPCRSILRHARCVEGAVHVLLDLWPRFEYGAFIPRFTSLTVRAAEAVGGPDALHVRATRPVRCHPDRIVASWKLEAGDEAWIEVTWSRSYDPVPEPHEVDADAESMRGRLDDTVAFWRAWMQRCWYEGEWAPQIRRSALVLKALTYAPSGALVAAPTTSLPEQIGGERNWDYRYTWIRDATLTLISLFVLGFTEEADAFKRWLERTGAGRPEDLQIVYGVGGERFLPELVLPQLRGHYRSAPVRIGNAAVKQLQLDSFGQILEAAYLYVRAGRDLTEANWRFIGALTDIVCDRWREPDQGIWEVRDEPRHFLHSKLNCWVALDRAIAIAEAQALPGSVDRWRRERDALAEYLMEEASGRGWFPQAAGFEVADASTLLVPAFGFLPTTHPAVERTVEVVSNRLGQDGLLHRYLTPDGLEGGEGAFLLCSFWLLDCLTHAGRLEEAEALLERLLGCANDVGLLAEEIDPKTGEPLGNFPQAYSHMALVLSCAHLSAAKRGELPDGAVDYAEAALGRLLARSSAPTAMKGA